MVKITEEVILKAFGSQKGGKSYLLYKIAELLRKEGYKVVIDSVKHNHLINVLIEYDINYFKEAISEEKIDELISKEEEKYD